LNKNIEVLVIGAGQAGLAMGYYLKKAKLSFVLVDAAKQVGDVWRNRYDSLVLFSPRAYSSLPGMDLPGDPEGFPTKDEIAKYLETYANYFSIPIHLNTNVEKLEQIDDKYRVITSQGNFIAKNVVIAAGPFQKPFIPKLHGTVSKRIFQIHTSEYRRPSQLPEGSILVVGGGNSGSQIATELSASRKVYLSTGHEIVFIPHRILNRSIFWWLDVLGLSKVSVDTKLSKFLKKTEPVIGMELKPLIASGKVKLKERAISFHDQHIKFKDGSTIKVDSIIWATGFQFDFSWIDIPGILDHQKRPLHQRGISPVKGIYFLGLPWLSRVGSAQLNGVGHDAKYLIDSIS
jgi:putative flavoprotein involved in K+ transport